MIVSENEGLRLHDWSGRMHWERWEIPDPAPGEVQVAVEACGVGLTVVNNISGLNWNDPSLLPRVPGHELVGRVSRVGDGVDAPAAGERVLAYFYLSCFRCPACRAGREDRCSESGGRLGVHRDGGYARFVNLPAGNAIPFPAHLDAAAATVIPDAVATSLHVCRNRLGLAAGDRLAVIGAGGGVGAHLVQVAQSCGAAVTGLDRSEEKLRLVAELGGTPVDSSRFGDVTLAHWDGVADAVVDLVGSPESLQWGLDHLAQGGVICVLTTFRDATVQVSPRHLVAQELTLMGSHYATRSELAEATRMVADGLVRAVVADVASPQDAEDLHQALRRGQLLGRGALRWPAA